MNLIVKVHHPEMESEVMSRLKAFSLSASETQGVDLVDEDVCVGLEEGRRSLIRKMFGEKRTNFVGVRSAMMRLWQHRGLSKVVALAPNVYQFIFQDAANREGVLQGRPWIFDNQLLVLMPWEENWNWKDERFNVSPFWIQVWHIPPHWMSIETGRKIGGLIGNVRDVMLMDTGGREGRYLKIQVDIDITTPLQRGTMLKYKMQECWVEFKYEQLPIFCFYCGQIGHNEKSCVKRKDDVVSNKVKNDQFGHWLRAENKRRDWQGYKDRRAGKEQEDQRWDLGLQIVNNGNPFGRDKVLESGNAWEGESRIDVGTVQEKKSRGEVKLVEGSIGKMQKKLVEGYSREEGQEKQPSTDLMVVEVYEEELEGRLQVIQVGGDSRGEATNHKYTSRVPLRDCTNQERLQIAEGGGDQQKSNKGQWKRRARKHKCDVHEGLVGKRDDAENRQREIGYVEGRLEGDLDRQPEKKVRSEGNKVVTFYSEVGDTSREWSQSYK